MDEGSRSQKDGMHPEPGHELRDVRSRPIVGFCLGLLLLVALSLWLTRVLFNYFAVRESNASSSLRSQVSGKPQLPPEPRLQVMPVQDRRQIATSEENMLHSYGWVNQSSGIVRIPIDKAMQLIVERGLPAAPNSEEKAVRRSK